MAEAPDRDLDDVVTVSEDGITVEKRFTTDEFPVPAVRFDLRSEADDPVEVRLTDEIPESFDMDRIGFHPEYEGDAWTAYRDHRVEYERTVGPGEEVTTVYGVRVDDPESGARFLDEPGLVRVTDATAAADPEEILGRETTGAVRDALAGKGELAADADPGDVDLDLEEPGDGEVGTDLDESGDPEVDLDEPGDVDLDLEEPGGDAEVDVDESADADLDLDDPAAVEGDDGIGAEGPSAGPRSVDHDLTPAVVPSDDTAAEAGPAGATAADGTTGDGADTPTGAVPGSVAAALAAEVNDGSVDDEDLAVLREALGADSEPGIPRSVEVRIDRLQNRTEDLAAYTGALEEFLDEEGTAREVLDDLDDRTAALREDVDAVASETADLDGTVADHDDRLDDLEAAAGDLEEHVGTLDDDLDDLGARVEDLEADLDDLAGDAESSVADLRETLDDLEATMADVEDELEDIQSFRERMRDAFGS